MSRFPMLATTSLLVAAAFLPTARAADDGARKSGKPAFRALDGDDVVRLREEGAVVAGRYVLSPDATKAFGGSPRLKQMLEQIEAGGWNRFTEQNARLTVSQRLDDYIQTASDFYDGKAKRRGGIVSDREIRYTDEELGDEQLSNALASVCMAGAWSIPLKDEQADALAALVAKRVTALQEAADRIEVNLRD